ncbi:hypothetical protein RR46_06959 [Papilio xuthus]|uniref:Uncharacterized protein n=1 Tax=Papilio xuthus TaxID=66420 RepID=A0A194PYJ6_PAPXU|nr:hypothetical protein RR46_06959 [Papilio xuthus]
MRRDAMRFDVARSADGAGLHRASEEDVVRLNPCLQTNFEMNDLPPSAYPTDTRRMQLYSHAHIHPTVSHYPLLFAPIYDLAYMVQYQRLSMNNLMRCVIPNYWDTC